MRLQQVIDDPDHSREQVAEIVAYDPSLKRARAAHCQQFLLQFSAGNRDRFASAVGIIGELDLRNLVLATYGCRFDECALNYQG